MRQAQARVVRVDAVRAPALVAFRAVVEGRIGEDVVGLEVGVLVVVVGAAQADVAVEAVDEEVQPAEAIGEVLRLLPAEGEPPAVLREVIALHEHAARAAARIEYFPLHRLQHRHEQLHDAFRREVFAAALPL